MPASLPTSPFEHFPAESIDDAVSNDFLDRDASWLEFNRRVLHEAIDERSPLLDRVRFLSIFSNNLDEFFMKRVGAMKRQTAAGRKRNKDGDSVAERLAMTRTLVLELLELQADCYRDSILPALRAAGVHLLAWNELDEAERVEMKAFFRRSVFAILTPLAVDPGHPFPFISNLSESVGMVLRHPEQEENLFARIKVPEVLPRWVRLNARGDQALWRFVSLYDIIRHNLEDLFPGMRVMQTTLFRVTRSADLDLDPSSGEDLRDLVEEELRQRRFAPVVRLEFAGHIDTSMRQLLEEELEVSLDDIYHVEGELDYQDLGPIADLNIPQLHGEAWVPTIPPALLDPEADIFSIIRKNDILVHHPYESFTASVERFISAAADDPKVLAIKMTLYRTGDESVFVHTLIRAAEARKQVVCLVELKARFDEERNIQLAHALEKAGVHVVYGVVGLKTHTKTALVVRQDSDGLRCYAHIGTGNYNTQTARQYTDIGLLTAKTEITDDLVELFHYLTGRSLQRSYRKLIVAPVNMRDHVLELIYREIDHRRSERPAHIIAKMNSLEDRRVCEALYAASSAGVEIDLLIRGFCCLRPGVPGLSDNIRVISVLGRFLEHSRITYFRNGSEDPVEGEFQIGSADWMYRNLLARVEVAVPVEDRAHRQRLWEILQVMMADNRQAWDMHHDGSYVQRRPAAGERDRGTHQVLMEQTRQRNTAAIEMAIANEGVVRGDVG